MAKIEKKKKTTKKKKVPVIKSKPDIRNEFAKDIENMLTGEQSAQPLMTSIVKATKNPKDFEIFYNQLFSTGNIVRFLITYLSSAESPSTVGFCKLYSIPLKYLKTIKKNNDDQRVEMLLDLLDSNDEIKYIEKVENARSTAQVLAGSFLLKTRHGYFEGQTSGGNGSGGNANVIVNFTPTSPDLISEINASGNETIENTGDKDED